MKTAILKRWRLLLPIFYCLFLALPLMLWGSVEVRAATASSGGVTLKANMTSFVEVPAGQTTYHMAQMSGKHLNSLGCNVNKEHQYFVWFMVDTKATSNDRWYTKRVYLTKTPVQNHSVANLGNKRIAEFNTSSSGKNSDTSGKVGGLGSLGGVDVSAGSTGTLFYYDSTKLMEIAEKNKLFDESTMSFICFLSPLIDHSVNGKVQNQDYTNCLSWFTNQGAAPNGYWRDKNYSNYTAHYNVPVRLESEKVKVITRHRTMGHRLDSDFQIADMDNEIRAGNSSDQIAATGKGIIQKDQIGYMFRNDKKPFNPDNNSGSEQFHTVDAFGKGTKAEYIVTGYTVYYINPKKRAQEKVYLAYNTYDVNNFSDTERALRVPAQEKDVRSVLQDKRFLRSGDSTDAFEGAEHNVMWFSRKMNTDGKIYLWLDEDHGLPNDVDEIYVDWLYTKAERLSVNVNWYYNRESIEEKTSPTGSVSAIDGELTYSHTYSESARKLVRNDSYSVKKGETWYSYETEKVGVDENEDDKIRPVLDGNGNPDATDRIPYVITHGKSPKKCYLSMVKITPDKIDDFNGMDAGSFWDGSRMSSRGNLKSEGGSFSAMTKAPYMSQYTNSEGLFNSTSGDWPKDADALAHFVIPKIKHSVTVDCYYSSTVPVQVLVYEDTGSYTLRGGYPKETSWCSQGTIFSCDAANEVSDANSIAAAFVVSDRSTKIKPYNKGNSYSTSYGSIADIKSISGCTQASVNGTLVEADVGYTPMYVIIIYSKRRADVGYTLVRYVHTGNGYIKTDDRFYPLDDTEHVDPHGVPMLDENGQPVLDENGQPVMKPEHAEGILNWTAKVFVSFQPYEEYDEGNQGLNGSIYKLSSVVYNYEGPNNYRPLKAGSVPEAGQKKKDGKNNNWYYLDEAGDEAKSIKAVTQEKRDSLVVYAIYEDMFAPEFPGNNPNGSRIVSTDETEDVFHWNWKLPDRFVWDSSISWDGSVLDGNLAFDPDSTSNPYFAKVFGTNESAVFKAQEAIPSSDYVRLTSSVPRYLTKGYWVRHNLKSIYKILCAQAFQSMTTKTMVDGDQKVGGCDYVTEHTYAIWADNGVKKAETSVERSALFYKLGDAEVWDPQRVTLENNTFSDSACSKDCLATLMPVNGDSHAFFVVSEAPANFSMPPIATNWLFINFGVVNGGSGSERYEFSDDAMKKKAESIIGRYSVCNDEVAFYDGLGGRTVLTTSTTGLIPKVSRPNGVPEAAYTLAGVFDSKNHTQKGIQLIPDTNNGHHDTLSTAYYKQVQCTNPEYRSGELIKTIIQDDGDDDVEIFTPMVNYSKINLDYDNGSTDSSGVTINPEYNYNQRSGESYGESKSVMALDMEYTLTLSCSGYNSDFSGYGTQNYARYLEKDSDGDRYMQVMFPFPVEMNITLADGGWEERYYKANSWISLKVPLATGEKTYTFFIPSWAGERDKANTKFRGITINARKNNPEFTMLQEPYNSDFVADELKTGKHLHTIDERNYIAQTHETDNLVGRLYGLQIIDISDYPLWQPVFREFDEERKTYSPVLSDNSYKPGLNNQNGLLGSWSSLWTIPTVDGSHPTDSSAGTLGTGYKIRYKMESVGNYFTALDGISIKPEFYYMNSKGEYLKKDGSWDSSAAGRKEVSVYYSETAGGSATQLVKVGSKEDQMNQKTLQLTDENFGIREDVLEKTAESMGVSIEKLNKIREQFSFSHINLTSDMRVYTGDTHVSYHKAVKGSSADDAEYNFNPVMYDRVKTDSDLAAVLSQDEILKSVQQWYGEYYLPAETFVTTSSWDEIIKEISGGFDGSEPCWLDGGYLVVNFKPVLTTGGKPRLNYDNTAFYTKPDGSTGTTGCDMFQIENSAAAKEDSSGRQMTFKGGDIVLYKITNRRSSDPNDPDPVPDPDDPNDPVDPDPDDRNDGITPGGGVSTKDGYLSSGTH